ncbi:hypothetical protein KKG22_02795 [Patescibacteria group bacterium]|nr:hypothetical protein [Patescibacteria group bacterium]MBU1721708.1 hypothetical protein [Patescibacteria group bacterium]MBU1900835.1 hypothetical protein [Patescibacteria group bacterium]
MLEHKKLAITVIIFFFAIVVAGIISGLFDRKNQQALVEPIGVVEGVEGLELFSATPEQGLRGRYTHNGVIVYFEAIRSGLRVPDAVQKAILSHEYNVEYRFYTADGEELFGPKTPSSFPNKQWMQWAAWEDADNDGRSDRLLDIQNESDGELKKIYQQYEAAYQATLALAKADLSDLELEIYLLSSEPQYMQELRGQQ